MQEIFIPLFFFLIADLIKIDVSDNFVNLSEHFKQMTGDLSFEKKTQGSVLFYYALAVSA